MEHFGATESGRFGAASEVSEAEGCWSWWAEQSRDHEEVLECWSVGVLERGSVGVLECWSWGRRFRGRVGELT